MIFGPINIPEEQVIAKTNLSYAFVNIRPFLPYHILLSPIRCEARLKDLTIQEITDLMVVAQKLVKGLECLGSSWNINLQDGKEAGQTIPHVHFHLVPRNFNDLKRNNDVYDNIDKSFENRDRTAEEMRREADYLKEMFAVNKIEF